MSHKRRDERHRREPSPAAEIQVSICMGDAATACMGKEKYNNCAQAQNGVYAWALHHNTPELMAALVVYDCLHCEFWHAGNSEPKSIRSSVSHSD